MSAKQCCGLYPPEVLADTGTPRQLAEEAAYEFRNNHNRPFDLEHWIERAITKAISARTAEWIPVSEKLPPDCSSYAERSLWLVNNAGNVQVAYWYPEEARWVDFGDYTITRQVTHWMPLPKPAK